ncbi:Gryzun, putative trafficking through golgi-domain-containing protein [Rhodofomes roseus]|uniref:Gryzun, putative trafficking through golgi-domain-containing protein n=1 Tax=Rhodofomes roseus TaxID=34475 RepID=A0ABQ8JYD0_9APHY|nr:Gryzun, putative trafficking through golgi-domain-containing protein [Rhodofomes roseus]KAH9829287.1 Gryzun, putative trafficking through golgi-domain-containing protein [Rhodofomes roseus]
MSLLVRWRGVFDPTLCPGLLYRHRTGTPQHVLVLNKLERVDHVIVFANVYARVLPSTVMGMVRSLLRTVNNLNPSLRIGEEGINSVLVSLQAIRERALTCWTCILALHHELTHLLEVQRAFHDLSYFDIRRRSCLTIRLARLTVSLPIALERALTKQNTDDIYAADAPSGIIVDSIALTKQDGRHAKIVDSALDQVMDDFLTGSYKLTILPEGGYSTPATTRFSLPTLRPPRDGLIALLDVPPTAQLHTPLTLRLVVRNRQPTRSANVVVHLETDNSDAFIAAGLRNGRLPILLPGAEETVLWRLVPVECGFVRIPRIRVADWRTDPGTEGELQERIVRIVDPSVDAGSLTWLAYTSGHSEKAGSTGVACVTPLARPPHRPPPLELRFNLVAKYRRSILKASPSLPKDPEAATDMGWRTDTASGRAERVGGPQQACASTRERNEERMYVAELLLEYKAHSRAVPQVIERDAKDPQFMAMLSKLGPVKVDHHMQTVRPGADQVQRVFQARQRSEEDAHSLTPTRNRMLAGTLYELLEER